MLKTAFTEIMASVFTYSSVRPFTDPVESAFAIGCRSALAQSRFGATVRLHKNDAAVIVAVTGKRP
jgi:hypothetical protein